VRPISLGSKRDKDTIPSTGRRFDRGGGGGGGWKMSDDDDGDQPSRPHFSPHKHAHGRKQNGQRQTHAYTHQTT